MPAPTYHVKLEGDAIAYQLRKAATLTGIHPDDLRKAAKCGELITFHAGGRHCVTRVALQSYLHHLEIEGAREASSERRDQS